MSVKENKRIVSRFVEEVWGQGNVDYAREVLAPDVVNHNVRAGQPGGLEGFIQNARLFYKAFPVRRFIAERLIASGNRVADTWTAYALHQGEFFGIAPTRGEIVLTGMDWYVFDDGKVKEVFHDQDVFGVMMQLQGILP